AAVLDAVAPADVAHLKARLEARVVARGDAAERQKARRQRHAIAVDESRPGVGKVEVVGQPGQHVVAKLALDAVAAAGAAGLEGAFIAGEDEFALEIRAP